MTWIHMKIPSLAKIELNKNWLPKQKTIQKFNIDAQGFKKQEMKILPCNIQNLMLEKLRL